MNTILKEYDKLTISHKEPIPTLQNKEKKQ
jgi:hypothetical protein